MNAYTFRFLTPEEKEQERGCDHASAECTSIAATIVQVATDGTPYQRDVFLCDAHAQEAAEAQGAAMMAAFGETMRHYHFYLEYGAREPNESDNGREGWDLARLRKGRASKESLFVRRIAHSQGNLVAIWVDEHGKPQSYLGQMTGYSSVFFHANSSVNGEDVHHDYLATCCERVSREQAAMVGHTQLFARMRADDTREAAFAAQGE